MKLQSCFLPCFLLLAFSSSANALYCGNRLISSGDHQAEVYKRCGEPVYAKTKIIYRSGIPRHRIRRIDNYYPLDYDTELLQHKRSVVEVEVEEWVYNFGPGRFMRSIRFEDGQVTRIRNLRYGYRD